MDFQEFFMLAVCALLLSSPAFAADGWAEGTTGGAGGTIVTVTTAAALKAYAETTDVPYIIQVLGTIDLNPVGGGIKIKSNKTIMGLNTSSTIIGRLGFPQTAPYSSNIIIEGLNITNPSYAEADGISVKKYVTNLFITKCTVYDCGDGCIDISNASDFVTVSWCKFYYSNPAPAEGHRFVNLFSSSDDATEDRNTLHITFHHNWWASRCDQRMPRGRFGKVHVYNNYYSCSGNLYCIGVGVESQLRVESNYFDGVNNAWESFNTGGYNPGYIGWNSDNQFVNGSTEPTWAPNDYNDPDKVFVPPYSYTLDDGADVKSLVMAGAGNLTPPSEPPQINWTKRHNGTANGSDYAKDIAVDSANSVYVTGYAKSTSTGYDIVTIKYTPDGNTAWTQIYNCPGSYADFASAMAVDANSNIIVAGYSYTATNYDGIIIKYNSSGNQLWAQKYNYSASSAEYFYDVAVDPNGNIYAVGRKDKDCLVVKYTPDGTFSWARIYNGTANGWDMLYSIAIDGSGNVYACGETAGIGTDQDCLTLKYSPAGDLLWAKTYNGSANGWDLLEAIALDSVGNVYVTGSVETATDSNYVTIKYSPNGGDPVWTAFYGDTATGWDESYAIAITSDDNVVVTGYSRGKISADTATVKYNSQTGAQLWAAKYSGTGDSTDYAEAIATDRLGNVYIHGRSAEAGSTDYLTICYNSEGMQQWKMNYNGPALLTDIGTAMAQNGNSVYVTGYSMNSSGNYDYATIKYTTIWANPCSAQPAGDLNGDCQVDFFDFILLADSYVDSTGDRLTLKDIADSWLECGLLNQDDCWQ